jgi:hypothetical protein
MFGASPWDETMWWLILTSRDGAVAREVEEERRLLLRKLARLFHTGRGGICLGTHRRRAAS